MAAASGTSMRLPTEALLKFSCEICCESKPYNNCFSIKGCYHYYCSDCVSKYIDSKLEHNIIKIPCPAIQCDGQLTPESCRSIISHHVFQEWRAALFNFSIPQRFKIYCPYKDCSALLVLDDETITRAECPYCMRFLCAQCKVGWHMGMDCKEFQKLKNHEEEKEDLVLHQLAEKKRWKQCPQCKIYIQLASGCHTVHCSFCGCCFCYGCGVAMGDPSGHEPRSRCFLGFLKRAGRL